VAAERHFIIKEIRSSKDGQEIEGRKGAFKKAVQKKDFNRSTTNVARGRGSGTGSKGSRKEAVELTPAEAEWGKEAFAGEEGNVVRRKRWARKGKRPIWKRRGCRKRQSPHPRERGEYCWLEP